LIFLTQSCEQRTEVELSADSPLLFKVSGSGRLAQLIIYGPEQEDIADPADKTHAVWEIIPIAGYGERVSNLQSITYGIVPGGYKQIIPHNGYPPTPLLELRRYSYSFVTMNAPYASGYFEIRDGRPAKVQGPCFETQSGKWVKVACP
jgi:hypothetical protein